MKEVPILFLDKDNCCGCTACFSVCPVGAIEMDPDKEGFLYPEVDASKCIGCYKCERVCAFKSGPKEKTVNFDSPNVYAVKHKDEDIRRNSRSGGIFTSLSDYVLKKGGVIYGCVMDESFKVCHIRAETAEERNRMRGSKYVQSYLGDNFKRAKKDLDEGRWVLFSGTGCQIDGFNRFLGKEYEKLLCVDIVCHGVPSPMFFEEYIKWQESKHGKLTSFDFRNKTDFGWTPQVETLNFESGERVDSRVFALIFASSVASRPSCYKCPYKSTKRPGDITIADYWGIDKAVPGFNDNKGVSLVLVNNETGQHIFDDVTDELEVHETKLEDSLQPALKFPSPAPDNRSAFWNDLYTKEFDYIAKRYGSIPLKKRIKEKLRKIKKKLF